MKFSNKYTNSAGAAKRADTIARLQCPPLPVPLEAPEPRELKKSEFLTLDLKSNPGDPNSERTVSTLSILSTELLQNGYSSSECTN